MVERLVSSGIASASILDRRLRTARYLMVETHQIRGKEVGGESKNGLSIIAARVNSRARTPAQQNHAILHETAHGLAATQAIIGTMATGVGDLGDGLLDSRFLDSDSFGGVQAAAEAIFDTLSGEVSDVNMDHFLAVASPEVGYWREINALEELTASNPELVANMWRAVFCTGLQNRQQGTEFAQAYFSHLPPDLVEEWQ